MSENLPDRNAPESTMAGRKPLPEDERLSERVEIRMTKRQREKLARLAGSDRAGPDWLRAKIDKAHEPKPAKTEPAKPSLPWKAG